MLAETADQRAAFMDDLLNKVGGTLENLWCRWQDEQDYEDFSEYKTIMQKHMLDKAPDGSEVVKIQNFFIHVKIPGFPYIAVVYINSGGMFGWKSGSRI